jgi:hypothetical protein
VARMHGSQVRAYLGGRDASGDISAISPKFNAATHEATTFASAGWSESDPGLLSWSADIAAFHDPAVGGIVEQIDALLGGSGVLSVYDGAADAIGDSGILFSSGILESRDQPVNVADLVKLNGAIKGNGRVGLFGKLLHPKGDETVTGNESSLDNTVSSANGGRANLHVTAITGSWTIKVQHSSDNAAWDDLITFTQVTAAGGVTAETKEVTGTVNRYLRVTSTEDVAGTITFVCGFARY